MATLISNTHRRYIPKKLCVSEIKTENIMALKMLTDFDKNFDVTKIIVMPYLVIDESYNRFKKFRERFPGRHKQKQATERIHKVFHAYFQKIHRCLSEENEQNVLGWMDELDEYMKQDYFYIEMQVRQLYLHEKDNEHMEELVALSVIMGCLNLAAGFIESFNVYEPDREIRQLQSLILELEIAMLGHNWDKPLEENKHLMQNFHNACVCFQQHYLEFFDKGKFERIKNK